MAFQKWIIHRNQYYHDELEIYPLEQGVLLLFVYDEKHIFSSSSIIPSIAQSFQTFTQIIIYFSIAVFHFLKIIHLFHLFTFLHP